MNLVIVQPTNPGCLGSPSVVPESGRIPREILSFVYIGNSKKLILTPENEYVINMIDW